MDVKSPTRGPEDQLPSRQFVDPRGHVRMNALMWISGGWAHIPKNIVASSRGVGASPLQLLLCVALRHKRWPWFGQWEHQLVEHDALVPAAARDGVHRSVFRCS